MMITGSCYSARPVCALLHLPYTFMTKRTPCHEKDRLDRGGSGIAFAQQTKKQPTTNMLPIPGVLLASNRLLDQVNHTP